MVGNDDDCISNWSGIRLLDEFEMFSWVVPVENDETNNKEKHRS